MTLMRDYNVASIFAGNDFRQKRSSPRCSLKLPELLNNTNKFRAKQMIFGRADDFWACVLRASLKFRLFWLNCCACNTRLGLLFLFTLPLDAIELQTRELIRSSTSSMDNHEWLVLPRIRRGFSHCHSSSNNKLCQKN